MTIHQLPKPCFILDPSPWDDDHGTPHYATWAEADEALRERRGELGPDLRDLASIENVRVRRLGAACWVAECDASGCEEQYESDEDGGNHFGSVAELETWMAPDGWTYRGGDVDEFWPAPGSWTRLHADEVFCSGHRPAGAQVPPPPPAELEAAGQLRLPGVA